MRVPMTSVQNREMIEYEKIERYTNRKMIFIFIKKKDEEILINLPFQLGDVTVRD